MQPLETTAPAADLRALLPHGAISSIARSLKMSHAAVSKALHKVRPAHPAVAEAVRLCLVRLGLYITHLLYDRD